MRHFREASDLLEQITTSTESSILLADAWLEQGKVNTTLKNYGAARLNFNQAIQEAEVHADEETTDSALVGEALYWIGVTHLLEPPLPLYDQAVRCLDSSAYRYPVNPRAADALLILGMLNEGRQDYEGALRAYRTLEERYPDRPIAGQAAIRAAQTLLLLEREKDAIGQLDANIYPLPIDPDRGTCVECELLRGNAFLSLNDYPGAERSFLTALEGGEAAQRRQAMLGLGDTYLAANRVDSAIALYRRLISDTVADRAGMIAELHYAIALADAGNDSLAMPLLERAASRTEPEAAGLALFELARRSYAHGDYRHSLALLDSSLAQTPAIGLRARVQLLRGSTHFNLGNADSAAVALHQADSLFARLQGSRGYDKSQLEAKSRLLAGIAFEQSGRHTEAITTLNRFLQQVPNGPGSAEALYWLGEAYYQSKLYQSTTQSLEDMIERFPNTPRTEPALYMLGWAYFKQQKYAKAEGAFSQLIKAYPLSPRRSEAQLRRADCLYLRKEFAAAADAYRQSALDTTLLTGSEYALYQSGLSALRAGDNDAAADVLDMFASRHPASVLTPDAAFVASLADIRRDSLIRAVAGLHRFTASYGKSPLLARAYMTLADAYTRLDDDAAATAAYRAVTEHLPAGMYTERARRALDSLGRMSASTGNDTLAAGLRYPVESVAIPRADLLLYTGAAAESRQSYLQLAARDTTRSLAPRLLLGVIRGSIALGDTLGLVDTLNVMATIYPGHPSIADAFLAVGGVLEKSDTARAADLYHRLRAMAPGTAPACVSARREAEMMVARGASTEARLLLRDVAAQAGTASQCGELWLRLADMDGDAGDADSVSADLEHAAARTDSIGGVATLRLVEASLGKGDTVAAASRLASMVERFGEMGDLRAAAQLRLGDLYGKTGETERARLLYQTIVKERPNDQLGLEARDRLQSLIRQ